MDLPTSVSSFSSGSAIQDTITPALSSVTSQSSGLGSLSAIPGMSTVSSTISSLVASTTATWQGVLSSLSVTLPVMKAIHVMESKLSMSASPGGAPSGGMASTTQGSPTFTSYFGSIQSAQSQVSALSSSVTSSISTMASQASGISGVTGSGPAALTSLAAAIPPATILQGGVQVTNPAYTSFMSTNSSALSGLTSTANSLNTAAASASTGVASAFSAAAASMASGVANLKSMAFASFCAQPQPTAVQNIISQTVNTSQVPTQDQVSQASKMTSAWLNSQSSTSNGLAPQVPASTSPDNLIAPPATNPTTYTPSTLTTAQKLAIADQIEAAKSTAQADVDAMVGYQNSFFAWKASVNYDAVKNNQATDPAAYAALKAQAEQRTDWLSYQTAYQQYQVDLKNYLRLGDILTYMMTTGPWPGNPNGPW